MECPLCNHPLEAQLDSTYFDCQNCGGIVMDNRFYLSPEKEKERYETHNNDVNDERYQKFTSPIWKHILANFSTAAKGLDFGSGTGPVITKVLRENGYQVALYDPYFAPDESVLKNKYNYIFSCEVIEHFYNPAKEFSKLFDMLLPGGELILMTHIYNETIPFKNWYYRKDPTHVFIYREETMVYIANEHQAEVKYMDERLVVMGRG
jgi:SAM-dependent methyltransferase